MVWRNAVVSAQGREITAEIVTLCIGEKDSCERSVVDYPIAKPNPAAPWMNDCVNVNLAAPSMNFNLAAPVYQQFAAAELHSLDLNRHTLGSFAVNENVDPVFGYELCGYEDLHVTKPNEFTKYAEFDQNQSGSYGDNFHNDHFGNVRDENLDVRQMGKWVPDIFIFDAGGD